MFLFQCSLFPIRCGNLVGYTGDRVVSVELLLPLVVLSGDAGVWGFEFGAILWGDLACERLALRACSCHPPRGYIILITMGISMLNERIRVFGGHCLPDSIYWK